MESSSPASEPEGTGAKDMPFKAAPQLGQRCVRASGGGRANGGARVKCRAGDSREASCFHPGGAFDWLELPGTGAIALGNASVPLGRGVAADRRAGAFDGAGDPRQFGVFRACGVGRGLLLP